MSYRIVFSCIPLLPSHLGLPFPSFLFPWALLFPFLSTPFMSFLHLIFFPSIFSFLFRPLQFPLHSLVFLFHPPFHTSSFQFSFISCSLSYSRISFPSLSCFFRCSLSSLPSPPRSYSPVFFPSIFPAPSFFPFPPHLLTWRECSDDDSVLSYVRNDQKLHTVTRQKVFTQYCVCHQAE